MYTPFNVAELAKDPSLIARIPSQSIHTLRGELAALDSLLLDRLMREAIGEHKNTLAKDRLLKTDEAAAKLGTTKDYLYRHADQFRFTVRMGRALRFSEAGIDQYIHEEAMNKRFR